MLVKSRITVVESEDEKLSRSAPFISSTGFCGTAVVVASIRVSCTVVESGVSGEYALSIYPTHKI